jgi:hypothetical protein
MAVSKRAKNAMLEAHLTMHRFLKVLEAIKRQKMMEADPVFAEGIRYTREAIKEAYEVKS